MATQTSAHTLYVARTIRRYFLSCPTLQQVAVFVLQSSLGQSYRWLDIDQAQPVLMEPVYAYENATFKLTGHTSLTLADALIARCFSGRFVDLSQGQFLAKAPGTGWPAALHVAISDVERVINEHGAQLLQTYQEALIDHWMSHDDNGQVRYLWLADALKHAFLLASGFPKVANAQLDMVIDTISSPGTVTGTQAFIVDQWGEEGATELGILRGLVLLRQVGSTTIVLLFTLSRGVQVFDSLEKLGEWLISAMTDIAPERRMQWRLFRPAHNIFRSMSLTFLARQLADINAVLAQARQYGDSQRLLERALRMITLDFDSPPVDTPPLRRLRAALPRWLMEADPQLQMGMARYAIDLGNSLRQPGWKPFDEGIASLDDFAAQTLSAQLLKDFPEHSLNPQHVKVSLGFDSPVTAPQPFWAIPPLLVNAVWALPAFAWLGLGGLDPHKVSLSGEDASGNGVWLTVEQMLELISRANISGAFIQLVNDKLKDQEQARWRKQRFAEQLRLQLPMLALEYHLKFPQAFSRRAYDAVVAVLQPQAAQRRVDGQEIVLRPLAFKQDEGHSDVVRTLFVIGPLDVDAGPHVLYRPLAEVKLIEFATWTGILASIRQPGPLQYHVLAWLDDSARSRYLLPDVAAPSLEVFQLMDFNVNLWSTAAMEQARDVVSGDYVDALFDSLVGAISSLPSRQALTGMNNFWDWVRRLFGLGLMLVLTLYGGPVGEALGWLLFAAAAWDEVSRIASADPQDKLAGLADLLVSIGLVLLSRGRLSRPAAAAPSPSSLLELAQDPDLERSFEMSWYEAPEQELQGRAPSRVAQTRLPTEHSSSTLARGSVELEQTWSGLYSRLSVIRQAELALYKVRAVPYAQRIHTGAHRGLYSAGGNLYVDIAGDWFKVEDHDGVIRVVGEDMALREGPQLKASSEGIYGFAPEPAQPEDLREAMRLEQLRLDRLKSDEKQRLDLDAEYEKLSLAFDTQIFTDSATLQGITHRIDEPDIDTLIEDELYRADVTHWSAITLLDALRRRRQLLLVRNFSALFNKFSSGAVQARRNQAVLYTAKRSVMLKADQLQGAAFDAGSLSDVVLNSATFRQLSPRLPDYAALHKKAIETCQDAEQRFEDMKRHGRAADRSVAALESSIWTGRRMSLKWQELQLRTLALQCFQVGATIHRDGVLDLIQEITSLCSLKLMTRRELFTSGHFNLDQQLRVLNDVLDALVLAYSRLSYQLGSPSNYIDTWGLGNLRSFVRELYREAEEDLIEAYQRYDGADLDIVSSPGQSGSRVLIDDVLDGWVIASRRTVTHDGETLEFADIMEPFDHRPVRAFQRFGSDAEPVWRTVPSPLPANGADLAAHEQLAAVGGEANRLWRAAQQQFMRIGSLETIQRMSPRRVRTEWLNYANRMITNRDLLMDALKVPAASTKHQELLEFFKNTPGELYEEITRFMNQSVLVRNRMIMERAPTSEGLLTLYKAWLVNVVEVPVKKPLMREFQINERSTGRPLWVARFYYKGLTQRSIGFHYSRGRLERYSERRMSYDKLKYRATNHERLINVLRTNIDHEVAEAVFFTEDVDTTRK